MSLRGVFLLFFFFFSSRRRHTRLQGDWSSDVCSSDLATGDLLDGLEVPGGGDREAGLDHVDAKPRQLLRDLDLLLRIRSEERRVGKECRSRGAPDDCRKKVEEGAKVGAKRRK